MKSIHSTQLRFQLKKMSLFSVLLNVTLVPMVDAATVSGTATITINNDAFASANKYGMYLERYWGSVDNSLDITKITTGGEAINSNGSTTMYFPVNSNTTTTELTSPCLSCDPKSYGRTAQATTMDTADTSSGQIGLSGAWRLNSPLGALMPYDFTLTKTSGYWAISTYDSAFKSQEFLKLTDVSETVNTKGELSLSGNIKWSGPTWPSMVGANTDDVIGSFNLIAIKALALYDSNSGLLTLPDVQAFGSHYAVTLKIGQINSQGHYLFSLSQAVETTNPEASYPANYDDTTGLLSIPVARIDGSYYTAQFRNTGDFVFELLDNGPADLSN